MRQQFGVLRKAALDATKANRGAITSARNYAVLLLQNWAEREIGDRGSAWDRFWDRIRSWGKEADDRTLAWEEARTALLVPICEETWHSSPGSRPARGRRRR